MSHAGGAAAPTPYALPHGTAVYHSAAASVPGRRVYAKGVGDSMMAVLTSHHGVGNHAGSVVPAGYTGFARDGGGSHSHHFDKGLSLDLHLSLGPGGP